MLFIIFRLIAKTMNEDNEQKKIQLELNRASNIRF